MGKEWRSQKATGGVVLFTREKGLLFNFKQGRDNTDSEKIIAKIHLRKTKREARQQSLFVSQHIFRINSLLAEIHFSIDKSDPQVVCLLKVKTLTF
jgi:hypothetical protein